jgi:aminoglycoside phosphotransferase (APT) family kinase protein
VVEADDEEPMDHPELDLVDVEGRLRRHLDATAALDAPIRLERIPTGASSLTYVASGAGHGPADRLVLKIAPPGLAPTRNRDVLRQARILRALHGRPGLVVPMVLFEDAGDPPVVPPFFGMEFVSGECFEPLSDPGRPPEPEVVAVRAESAAGMLAALQAVPIDDLGVGDVAPIGLAEEVDRWARLFATVDDELRPAPAAKCERELRDHQPDGLAPVLVHGDYRLGNIIFDGTVPGAIVDWEIWSFGDPRIDVAWFALNSDPTKPNAIRAGVGMPDVRVLVERYEAARGVPVPELGWFHALVRFKQAAASAALVKNNRKVAHPNPRVEGLAPHIRPLLDLALGYLG